MKRIIFLIAALSFYFSYFFIGVDGYDPILRTIVCHSPQACLHEIGHKIDQESGWISASDEYRIAIANYTITNWYLPAEDRSPIAAKIVFFPGIVGPKHKNQGMHIGMNIYIGRWGGTRELYAEMLCWSGGDRHNMPEEFVEFYDWDLVAFYIEKYLE